MSTTYPFDDDLMTEVAACICWDADFLRRSDGLIKPAYFATEVDSGLVQLALEFWAKHKEAPSSASWTQLAKDGFLRKPPVWKPSLKTEVVDRLRETKALVPRNRGYLLEKIEEFARQRDLTQAMMEAIAVLSNEADEDRFQKVRARMTQSFQVGLRKGSDQDYDLVGKVEERLQKRLAIAGGALPPTGVTTGIPELDDLLSNHRGWGRAELSLFMGAWKSTKSFFLTYCATRALVAGYNVLFVTLENSTEIQAERMEAALTDIAMGDMVHSPHAVAAAMRALTGLGTLRIRSYPTGTFRPADLERLLDEYAAAGVFFDLVVVDYLDVMAPDRAMENEREASKSIFTRVRGIGGTYEGPRGHPAILSATQLNREGAKAVVANGGHVAEDINRVRQADVGISINRTDDEKAQGKARLHIAFARNVKDGVTLFIRQNLAKGMAVEEVEAVE